MRFLSAENKKQLAIGVVISLLLIGIGLVKGFHKSPVQEVAARAPIAVAGTSEPVSTASLLEKKREARRREKALADIAEHKTNIEMNWNAYDTPDRLMAVGNLYQYQLKDSFSAIQNYRDLVSHFPNHSKAPQAYIEIATCYERMGDEVQARYVYQEMVDSLDPSLQHTQFAKLKLEGK
jgi:tetratricopeptide (TPR) repeat protein